MIEATRDAVLLSRPPAPETPRHLQKPCNESGTVGKTTDLKALARLVLARDSRRSPDRDGISRGCHTASARLTQSASGVSGVSSVSLLTAASWTDAEEERAAIIEVRRRGCSDVGGSISAARSRLPAL